MTSCDFITTTHGKWILAGEHTVLRGGAALVFPLHDKLLTLRYHAHRNKINERVIQQLLEHGLRQLNRSATEVTGYFDVQSSIPMGVGMGASAALCVAMARWFAFASMITPTHIIQFAKQLEDFFHGQSSGVDIAGAASDCGLVFQNSVATPLEQAWQPHWSLSSCGQTGLTAECIQRVQSLRNNHPNEAEQIDQQMCESVSMARSALEQHTPHAQALLINAINMANDCFARWGLLTEPLQSHLTQLRTAGALAAKPTGSGGGGLVLSLWNNQPLDTGIKFITLCNKV